jgi:hypothetical protein
MAYYSNSAVISRSLITRQFPQLLILKNSFLHYSFSPSPYVIKNQKQFKRSLTFTPR